MSYLALLTLVQGDDKRDYLSDDLCEGEAWAELCGTQRTFGKAIMHLAGAINGPALLTPTQFSSAEHRQEWIATWIDQMWEVEFEPDGEFVRVTILGKDTSGEAIFMRRTVYGSGVLAPEV